MRNFVILFFALVVAGCRGSSTTSDRTPSAAATSGDTPAVEWAAADSAQDFLLVSAASDLRKHGPLPLRFRDVHMRYLLYDSGGKMYLLCGQFLTERQGGKTEWVPFATIKTSGYEQYIGATKYCEEGMAIEGRGEDLSSLLQTRFDSLK